MRLLNKAARLNDYDCPCCSRGRSKKAQRLRERRMWRRDWGI